MVTRQESKSRKQRGKRTHGWGMGKKHRGAGNRGGRGRAGLGKRGAQKKTLPLSQGKKAVGKVANNNTGMEVVRNKAIIANTINLSKTNNIKQLDLNKEADLLDASVQKVLDDGLRTKDIMSDGKKEVTTTDMGDAIISKLK